ncbi:MAG: glycosyltransferase family 2 protein [Candidatus Bathyarchaeia archaeon]
MSASRCLETKWPSVSIGIPTLNSERYLHSCLRSIFAQKYPGKIEVVVVDGGSTDRTLQIARRFPVKLIETAIRNPELAKLTAFRKSTGEVFFYLDDDNELISPYWLRDMIYPLIDGRTIVGSFTHHLATKQDPAITRYLSYDKLQRDPLLKHFSVGIEETFVAQRTGYILCNFIPSRIPPVGLVLYRREDVISLLETELLEERRIFDIDLPMAFAINGRTRFAYVPVGVRHVHADNMHTLIRKRIRNVKSIFLPTFSKRKFVWFSAQDKKALTKIVRWLYLANIFVPLMVSGLKKYMRYRDAVLLLEPLVGLVLTDVVLLAFISDCEGRRMIGRALRKIFSRGDTIESA